MVGAIFLCFIARGLFYACATPLWEGFDEHGSVAALEAVAAGSLMPPAKPQISREMESSLRTVPLPRGFVGFVPAAISHDEFWSLPDAARGKRAAALGEIPVEWRNQPGAIPPVYNTRRAPLYFWLLRPVYSLLGSLSLVNRVFVLRALNVLLASAAIPIGFLLARALLEDNAAALCAVAAFAAMPQVAMNVAHAGPEPLALVLATALALAAVRAEEPAQIALYGVLLVFALLAETHFVLLPAVCVLTLLRRSRAAAISCAIAGLLALWWYSAQWSAPGSAGLFDAFEKVEWIRAADFTWNTLVWTGNGSFLGLRSWTYRIMLVVLLVAVFGLSRTGRQWKAPVWILLGFHAAVALVLMWEGLQDVRTGGMAVTPGWYLGCLAAAGASLAVYGFRGVTPGASPIPAFTFGALDLYGLHIVLMPYYAGLISYSATGRLAAFPLGRWSYLVFDRLAINKPVWINSTALSGLWAAYAISTFALIGLAYWTGRAVRVNACRSTD